MRGIHDGDVVVCETGTGATKRALPLPPVRPHGCDVFAAPCDKALWIKITTSKIPSTNARGQLGSTDNVRPLFGERKSSLPAETQARSQISRLLVEGRCSIQFIAPALPHLPERSGFSQISIIVPSSITRLEGFCQFGSALGADFQPARFMPPF
jgi:hypothetical protein